jgi:hypothetical protein
MHFLKLCNVCQDQNTIANARMVAVALVTHLDKQGTSGHTTPTSLYIGVGWTRAFTKQTKSLSSTRPGFWSKPAGLPFLLI